MALATSAWICIMGVMGIVATTCNGMSIPEDMEILDGYDLGSRNVELPGDEDGFYERRSLLEPLYYRAIRNKREGRYRVLESPGLNSHFRSKESDFFSALSKKRTRRDVGATESPTTVTTMQPIGPETRANMPLAEKQTMDNLGRVISEQWTKTSYKLPEFQAKVLREEADSDAEASMLINEGIKSRAPRVNFITQQTKTPESPTEGQDAGNKKIIRELYHRPMARIYYERPLSRAYDTYMAPSQSPMYPQVYNKYDAFHTDMIDRMHPPSPYRYDQYYQRRYDVDYDSYYPHYKFPFYYYYPDKRYDVPLYYRDRNYLYTNDITDLGPPVLPTYHAPLQPTAVPSALGSTMRNRRIIYYATLPEIVRTPPNVDLHYRLHQGTRNRYESFFTTRAPSTSSAYKDLRPVNDHYTKENKYVSSKPIKIVRDVDGSQDKQDDQQATLGDRFRDGKNYHSQQRRLSDVRNSDHSGFRDVGPMVDSGRSYFGRRV